jgi:hypothetical protein
MRSPHPFSILHVNVQTFSGKVNAEDPVSLITRYKDAHNPQHNLEILFDSNKKKKILEAFCSYAQDKDLIFSFCRSLRRHHIRFFLKE